MTTREIRKDKNNKLSKKQCMMFLTEYEKLLKNEIRGVINPITNNLPVKDEKRLNYIVKYCRRTFAYDDNEKKIIEGHINTRDTFTVNIDSYDKRSNGMIWASTDQGNTWPIKKKIDEFGFKYSSIAIGRKNTKTEGMIYILYETGKEKNINEYGGGKIARFNYAWLLNNDD